MLQSRIIPFIGGGPTPATILSGLVYELDPQRVTLASGRIADWENGIQQTDAAAQALYSASDALFNGQPIASFDSSAPSTPRYYPVGNLSAQTAGEIFTVLTLNYGLPPEFPSFWPSERMTGMHRFGASGNNIHVPYTDGNVYDDFGCTARYTIAGAYVYFVPDAPQLLNVYCTAGTHVYNIDGNEVLNRSSGYTVGFSSAATFGASLPGTSTYMVSARVAYHCLCSQVQTPAARAAMKQYLSLRFATPGYWS